MGKLTRDDVRKAKPGRHADGAGLYLLVKPSGARSWLLRIQYQGQRRDIGLGAVDMGIRLDNPALSEIPLLLRKSLSLGEAREKAYLLSKLAKAGLDPIAERDRERTRIPTFAEAMAEAHKALGSGWTDRTAKQFLSSLEEHASPKLGALRVDAIGSSEVIGALAPIWTDKPVMARKVRSRIGQVLAFSKARGWRTEALPDPRELRSGLSKQARGGNFAAMPYADVPAFVAGELGKSLVASRAAMLFAILTAARSGEVRQSTWEQVDLKAGAWTRPGAIMKMREPHVVTLCCAAVKLLSDYAPAEERRGLIFVGLRGGVLSDMTLTKAMRSAGRKETLHGFRSSFRDWAAEQMPTVPAMVAEMALAHSVGSRTEQAYLRSDLRDMRRSLMEAWGRFVSPSLSGVGPNVIPINRNSEGVA